MRKKGNDSKAIGPSRMRPERVKERGAQDSQCLRRVRSASMLTLTNHVTLTINQAATTC
jgi:hypothetical protein